MKMKVNQIPSVLARIFDHILRPIFSGWRLKEGTLSLISYFGQSSSVVTYQATLFD